MKTVTEISNLITSDMAIVGIDETQFFDDSLILVINQLVENGERVVCAGLDMWINGKSIEIMGLLACISDEVTEWKAIYTCCGADAYLSHRKEIIESTVNIEGTNK